MDINIDEMTSKLTKLLADHKSLSDDTILVKSELTARRSELKRAMDEVKELGYNPNDLASEIRREAEVFQLKISNFESELGDVRRIVDPMVKEIRSA